MDENPKRKAKNDEIKTWTWKNTALIVLAGVVYGIFMLVIFHGNAFRYARDINGLALIAFLGIVPMVIGGLSTYMIPASRRGTRKTIGIAISSTLIFVTLTILIEPVLFICVAMALPFILGFVILGVLLSRLFQPKEEKKKKCYHAFAGFTLLLPVLIAPIELSIESAVWNRNVQDEIVIRASAEDVWNNIIRMDSIDPEEQRPSIYHTLGIPRPVRATLNYEGLGAERVGYFEEELTFVETIIQWELYSSVRFAVDVRHNDKSTAVLKHIGGPLL